MPFEPKAPQPGSLAAGAHSAGDQEAGPLPWGCTVYGVPVAKARPRFARRGKFVTTYNAQDTEEGRLLWELRQVWGAREPMTRPVSLAVEFGMPIPTSTSGKRQRAMARGEILPAKKPDLDNLVKFIKDVANGLLWKDDSQVCVTNSRKVYAERPYTKISVMEIV